MNGRYVALRDKIERAFRNGERLHLDVEQVGTLVRSPLFSLLADLVAKEFSDWAEGHSAVESTAPTTTAEGGSSTGLPAPNASPSARSGRSPNTPTASAAEALEAAERRRAMTAVATAGGARRRR